MSVCVCKYLFYSCTCVCVCVYAGRWRRRVSFSVKEENEYQKMCIYLFCSCTYVCVHVCTHAHEVDREEGKVYFFGASVGCVCMSMHAGREERKGCQ